MSNWTYIRGIIEVTPIGETQPEKRYSLDTILNHLPVLYGSEEAMNIYVIQKNGHDTSCWTDELGGVRTEQQLWYKTAYTQSQYLLILDGYFRDTEFAPMVKNFEGWYKTLCERIYVGDTMVRVFDFTEEKLYKFDNNGMGYIYPSWSLGGDDKIENWLERNSLWEHC